MTDKVCKVRTEKKELKKQAWLRIFHLTECFAEHCDIKPLIEVLVLKKYILTQGLINILNGKSPVKVATFVSTGGVQGRLREPSW